MFNTTLGDRCGRCVEGPVLAHEHLVLDLRTDDDPDAYLDHDDAVTAELSRARDDWDLGLVVDVTTRGMGASHRRVTQVSRASGVPVAVAVGFYLPHFRESSLQSLDHARDLLQAQLVEVNGPTPAVIGEVGVTPDLTRPDRWALESCLLVAAASQRPAVLHSHLAQANRACREMVEAVGIDPALVCVAHQDLADGLGPVLDVLELGAYIAFDTIGKTSYTSDEQRLRLLRDLVERGWGHRIMISNDVSRHAYLESSGGTGYAHCLGTFTTKMARVFPPGTVEALTRDNALRWMDAASGPCDKCEAHRVP